MHDWEHGRRRHEPIDCGAVQTSLNTSSLVVMGQGCMGEEATYKSNVNLPKSGPRHNFRIESVPKLEFSNATVHLEHKLMNAYE